jgi:cell division protein FtsB
LEEQNLEMSERISGLHLELIRQFTSQYNTMTHTMERLAKENQKYKTELKDLREENEKLKKISY